MTTVQPTLNYVTLMLFVKHWKTAMAAFVTMDTLETEKSALVITNYLMFVNQKLRRVIILFWETTHLPLSPNSTFCTKWKVRVLMLA